MHIGIIRNKIEKTYDLEWTDVEKKGISASEIMQEYIKVARLLSAGNSALDVKSFLNIRSVEKDEILKSKKKGTPCI